MKEDSRQQRWQQDEASWSAVMRAAQHGDELSYQRRSSQCYILRYFLDNYWRAMD